MKKFLTLVLALVLALGLTVPAMAFTSDTEEDDDSVPYELSIYLVEYDDNDFFGITTLPESDRGYAKNEIVAAIVELVVPEGEAINTEMGYLEFGGDNVSLNVTDNDNGLLKFAGISGQDNMQFVLDTDDDTLTRADMSALQTAAADDDETFKWLFFAKVTDDEASLYAKLVDGLGSIGFEEDTLVVTLDGVTYGIAKSTPASNGDFSYVIVVTGGDYANEVIYIDVDEDNVSLGMSIEIDDNDIDLDDIYDLGVNTKGELGIVNGAILDTSGDEFDAVMDVYEDVVIDVFGLDYFNIGNYVRDSYFEDLVSVDTVIATVDIEPWTAYVVVPDNIVVDPPKTGDAASIVGFVMVALAGGSAVALKKRG